jgi:mycothiol system anti-sigma-R factor
VLNEVYLYLDGEIDADRRQLIREHLDECSPCLRQFGIEQEVKLLVARRCGGERAPEALRVSVLTRLRAARVEWGAAEFSPE